MEKRNSKVILCILDGFGKGRDYEFNAVSKANKPNLDRLFMKYPSSELVCSGFDVGLPKGTMGNSEVGHLNIGAGRIVFQDIGRINKMIEDGEFSKNPALRELYRKTSEKKSSLHLMGLVSNGDVHSSLPHLYELIRSASESDLEKIYIHVFTDGRDTPPQSGAGFVKELESYATRYGAKIASVSGRYYAMDRDKRWERIKKAYDCLTESAKGSDDISAEEIIERSYFSGVTDEFIHPQQVIENKRSVGIIEKGDSVIFFNFRADRAREISIALNSLDKLPFDTPELELNFLTMTEYSKDFTFKVISPKQHLQNILGEEISKYGLRQLRIAETEKYAHVTFFFNGGEEKSFPGEDRILIPSPKVATYDLKPEMSAFEVTEKVLLKVSENIYDLIVINFANCDMVGHTGVFEAAVKAVETIDKCVGMIYESAQKNRYTMILTADHGNAECMMDGDTPFTAHTKNRVPFLITLKNAELNNGKLADIAPTILACMHLNNPDKMTGVSLINQFTDKL